MHKIEVPRYVPSPYGNHRQILSFRLADGHRYTSATVQKLPCSSMGSSAISSAMEEKSATMTSAAGLGGSGLQDPGETSGCKEFIVLSSYILYGNEVDKSITPGLHKSQVKRIVVFDSHLQGLKSRCMGRCSLYVFSVTC